MDKTTLTHWILSTFPTVNPPPPDTIVEGTSGEAIAVKGLLAGRAWNSLDTAALVRENAALGYLSDQAFRYYLPAYMLLLIDDLNSADILASSVIRHLTLPLEVDTLRLQNFLAQTGKTTETLNRFLEEELRSSSSKAGRFIRRVSGFTDDQGRTINQFLRYLAQHHADYFDEDEPTNANTRYWFRFGE